MPDPSGTRRARFWRVIRQLVDPVSPLQFDQRLLEDLADAWEELAADERAHVVATLRSAADGHPIAAVGP